MKTATLGGHPALDLRGQDYFAGRKRLFCALAELTTGRELSLLTSKATDVYWLRFEAEERMSRRYTWSLPEETDTCARTLIRAA